MCIRSHRTTSGACFIAFSSVLMANTLLYKNDTLDGARITFRYARNLMSGVGVFNPGGPPTDGYASLPRVLLVAFGFGAGVDPFLLTVTIDVLILLAAPFALRRPMTELGRGHAALVARQRPRLDR